MNILSVVRYHKFPAVPHSLANGKQGNWFPSLDPLLTVTKLLWATQTTVATAIDIYGTRYMIYNILYKANVKSLTWCCITVNEYFKSKKIFAISTFFDTYYHCKELYMYKFCTLIHISLKSVPGGSDENSTTLDQTTAWQHTNDRIFPDPILT